MTKNSSSKSSPPAPPGTTPDASASIHDSAQQIWQAGLGAFTRAQLEGSKTFESLVKEGVEIQRKTQAAAEEKLAQATQHMAKLASNLSGGAAGPWNKLGTIFEDRVARALQSLGVPCAAEVAALTARIDALSAAVDQLSARNTAHADQAPAAQAASAKPKAPKVAKAPATAKTSKPRTPARSTAGTGGTHK